MSVQVLQGDCIQVMRGLKDNSVDSVVTDPPAGIAFMNKEWDDFRRSRNPADVSRDNVFGRTSAKGPEYGRGDRDRFVTWMTAVMAEAIRVLKPGGHALVWSIPRTSHWTAWALEDAGFEIRDCIMHIFGTGFPKSLSISKAIDREVGAEREVIGDNPNHRSVSGVAYEGIYQGGNTGAPKITAPATEAAKQWEGWGTALKPSYEGWWLCRKPFREKTAAANVLEWGTGGINVDACRVETGDNLSGGAYAKDGTDRHDGTENWRYKHGGAGEYVQPSGRFPPNLLLTHSAECEPAGTAVVRGDNRQGGAGRRPGGFGNVGADAGDAEPNGPLYGNVIMQVWDCVPGCPVIEMDEQSGTKTSGKSKRRHEAYSGESDTGFLRGFSSPDNQYDDTGGASRFFPVFKYQAKAPAKERVKVDGISHPTCKPLGLMRWLVRLVTPPDGVCLDMFAGSGTTGEACLDEGFNCILIEREPDYIKLIKERLGRREPTLWDSLWE